MAAIDVMGLKVRLHLIIATLSIRVRIFSNSRLLVTTTSTWDVHSIQKHGRFWNSYLLNIVANANRQRVCLLRAV
jgi:hypothetical protein